LTKVFERLGQNARDGDGLAVRETPRDSGFLGIFLDLEIAGFLDRDSRFICFYLLATRNLFLCQSKNLLIITKI
jgi:hypothetical protein